MKHHLYFLSFPISSYIINGDSFQCIKKWSRCGHFSVCLWLMETERVCFPRVHWDSICVQEFPWICSTPWGVSSNGWWVILWYRHYITVSLPAQCSLIIHKTHTHSHPNRWCNTTLPTSSVPVQATYTLLKWIITTWTELRGCNL